MANMNVKRWAVFSSDSATCNGCDYRYTRDIPADNARAERLAKR